MDTKDQLSVETLNKKSVNLVTVKKKKKNYYIYKLMSTNKLIGEGFFSFHVFSVHNLKQT